jgi:hypothetical protein
MEYTEERAPQFLFSGERADRCTKTKLGPGYTRPPPTLLRVMPLAPFVPVHGV